MVVAVLLGAGLTVLVLLLPFARFAYENAALHLALETGEGLIAALLAYLFVHRHRATGRLQHLALAWVFSVLAFANLFLSAGPLVSERGRPGSWLTWATLDLRLVAVIALFAAAWSGRRLAPRGPELRRRLLLVTSVTMVVVALGATAAAVWLAEPVGPLLSPEARTRPSTLGHPLVTAVQLLGVALYAGAAVGFMRQATEQRDELLRWLGGGAVLGAFARVNYTLFPSLYSSFVYTGDVLRLGSYLFFLVGAAREIDAYWRDQTRLAAVEERSRMARDLHDGLAQELAFIRSQTAAMAAGMAIPGMEQHLSAAAERALAESRRAVQALSGDDTEGEPLVQALRRAAEDVTDRAGAAVAVDAADVPGVSREVHETLARVTREAANNAVRHGSAGNVSIHLRGEDGRLRLTVADDGTGFDPATVRRGYGLRSMRERVEGIGGEITVRSEPGQGSSVEVIVPLRRPGW